MSRKHGATWWSGRFLRSLERLGMTTRLRRGHAYFEQGRVLDCEVRHGVVAASVQCEQEEHECQIYFEPFSDLDWNEGLERLAFKDLSAAALLTTGRMPPQIEDFFQSSGRRLLPQGEGDLEFQCTCADRSIPCKHMAATAYKLAEMLDSDPWILFLLRGRSAREVEDALIELWNRELSEESSVERGAIESPSSEQWEKVDANVDLFWGSQLKEPILFPLETSTQSALTVDRMSVPEPKVNSHAWKTLLQGLYSSISERAEEKLV